MAKSTKSNETTPNVNGFQFFEGHSTISATTPQITVRRNGLMVLTAATVAMLGDGVTRVRFGFDEKSNSIGLQGASDDVKGSYLLRSQKHGASKTVDGRRFLTHLGVKFEAAKSFEAEDFGGGIVGMRLPNGDNN